jgi:hypothetical protein
VGYKGRPSLDLYLGARTHTLELDASGGAADTLGLLGLVVDNNAATRSLDLADLVAPGVVAVAPPVGDTAVDSHFGLLRDLVGCPAWPKETRERQ